MTFPDNCLRGIPNDSYLNDEGSVGSHLFYFLDGDRGDGWSEQSVNWEDDDTVIEFIRMVETLVSQFGDPLPADPARHAFPTPDRLAATDAETLRSTARLGYRAPYVVELARAVASGTLDLESLRTADIPAAELRKRLLAIKGVGGYAAANLLMILGHYDFVPVDSWALKMVSHEWHGGEPVGPAEVEAAFEHWGEWKGLAYWFWDWSYAGGA